MRWAPSAAILNLMKTTANTGFAVGSTVALTEEYVSLFETFSLRNVICEVVDARRAGAGYVYYVAPVGAPFGAPRVEAYASDLRAVRS